MKDTLHGSYVGKMWTIFLGWENIDVYSQYNNSPLPGAARSKYFLKEREYKYSLRQHADFSKFYLWMTVWRNGLKFFLGKHSLSNIVSKSASDQSTYLQPLI